MQIKLNEKSYVDCNDNKIERVVLSGGGAKGVVYPGAYKALIESGLIEGVKIFSGASAGAITAAFMAFGVSPETLRSQLFSKDFKELLGAREGALFGNNPGIFSLKTKDGKPLEALIRENIINEVKTWLKDSRESIACIAENEPELNALIEKIKQPEPCITFYDLEILNVFFPQRFKLLVVTAVTFPDGEVQVFNSKLTPNVEIAKACRASASLPVVLSPIEIEINGEIKKFVDGGLHDNFPTDYFDTNEQGIFVKNKKPQQTLIFAFGEGLDETNNQIFQALYGQKITLYNPGLLEKYIRNDSVRVLGDLNTPYKNTDQKELSFQKLREEYPLRTVELRVGNLGTRDFDEAMRLRNVMDALGFLDTMNHITNHNLQHERFNVEYFYTDLVNDYEHFLQAALFSAGKDRYKNKLTQDIAALKEQMRQLLKGDFEMNKQVYQLLKETVEMQLDGIEAQVLTEVVDYQDKKLPCSSHLIESISRDYDLLNFIKTLTVKACDDYQRQHLKGDCDRGYTAKTMAGLTHQGWQSNVFICKNDVLSAQSVDSALAQIHAFLTRPNSSFRSHSLSAYLLDELSMLFKQPDDHFHKKQYYSLDDWIRLKKKLDTLFLTRSENLPNRPFYSMRSVAMGNQQRISNQISDNETRAVQLANQCKEFIKQVKWIASKKGSIAESMKKDFNSLSENVLSMLATINEEAIEEQLPEIRNYYYLYLLQQVSKFNQLVGQVVLINDERDYENKGKIVKEDAVNLSELTDAGIGVLVHPLLKQPEKLFMEVTIKNDPIFRDRYIDDDEGSRYYYHERKTEKGKPHQDRDHYKLANAMIGGPTQVSNLTGLFKSAEKGQAKHHYFKHADRDRHAKEKALFKEATLKIQTGKKLSKEEIHVFEFGKYYRYNSPFKFKPTQDNISSINGQEKKKNGDYQITHIGHAAELISIQNTIPLNICIDPVHYQSGTGGFIELGGKILYDRQTEPAFGTDGYPGVNIVLISHNHFDHMCQKSLMEAFGQSNTLFVVPVGDAKHLKSFGLTNVVELGSWNDVLEIQLTTIEGKSSSYEIRSFPANHASCRGLTDFFESLYMGYMIRETSKNELILCTGDTAVLESDHFEQLGQYLLKNDFSIETACIAHGPDRPRQWMECSHQSTADALTMHAEFNVMNALVFMKNQALNEVMEFDELKQSACFAIGYHQGCYRLGLLSLSDVDTTLLRTFSVLKSLGETPINEMTQEFLSKNVFYNFMDKFEQDGLISTLAVYNRIQVKTGYLTANQVLDLITTHLNVPQPGYRSDFSQELPYDHFIFDYNRLLLNKNPNLKGYDEGGFKGAFDEFCFALEPIFYEEGFNKLKLATEMLTIYLDRPINNRLKDHGHDLIKEFIEKMKNGTITSESIEEHLGTLYSTLFPQQDENIREEGHSHTAMTMIAGLIYFPDFRQTLLARYNELHNIIDFEEKLPPEVINRSNRI